MSRLVYNTSYNASCTKIGQHVIVKLFFFYNMPR
jgi:hypothetical protein